MEKDIDLEALTRDDMADPTTARRIYAAYIVSSPHRPVTEMRQEADDLGAAVDRVFPELRGWIEVVGSGVDAAHLASAYAAWPALVRLVAWSRVAAGAPAGPAGWLRMKRIHAALVGPMLEALNALRGG